VIQIFEPDDPLVVNGTYDIYGYTPSERRARERRQKGSPTVPRQQSLTDDLEIKDLEKVAAAYAELRDQRMALNQDEARLKQQAMALMKKHKKKRYVRDGIEITLESGEETIKVKVKKAKDDEEEED